MFGTASLPNLVHNQKLLDEMARATVNKRIAITGAQPKLSVELENVHGAGKRLTIVGLWGKYILKPQHPKYAQMPETEDLTMHLASHFRISTCQHCLVPTSDGQLVYLAKRFDRLNGKKIHMEDFCQLSGFQTEQKYNSSYERVGKLIRQHCSNSGLDTVNYFQMLVFCFLTGNNDMHLKNFSVLHQKHTIELSPAYDLINSHLINPEDKEDMAMLLNGKRKKLQRRDFEFLAKSLLINETICNRILKKFASGTQVTFETIGRSFLTDQAKQAYKAIWAERLSRLGF